MAIEVLTRLMPIYSNAKNLWTHLAVCKPNSYAKSGSSGILKKSANGLS
jgi:hypothetical protein